MTKEKVDRANEILYELKHLKNWRDSLDKYAELSYGGFGRCDYECYRVSPEMTKKIETLVNEEIAELEKEFENI